MRLIIGVSVLTVYIIAFYVFLYTGESGILTFILYLSFPIVLVLMILNVLMDDSVKYPELGKEEWGYCDKKKEDLWIV